MRAIFSQWGKDVLNKGASLSGKNILSISNLPKQWEKYANVFEVLGQYQIRWECLSKRWKRLIIRYGMCAMQICFAKFVIRSNIGQMKQHYNATIQTPEHG